MLPQSNIDKYHITQLLGSGNFGVVYCASDMALNQEKAIKIIDVQEPNDYIQKLEEAQILHKCKHKHIVRINEANIILIEGKAKVVLDMEYIKGGSLEKRMGNHFISAVDARKIFIDVLFGLEHAHNQNILHRDIKPANIMLDENYAKLSDFGLATDLGNQTHGSPQGYITHLAPETVCYGKTSVQTDIYAMGITLFRVMCNLKEWRTTLIEKSDLHSLIKKGKLIDKIGFEEYVPNKLKRVINKAVNPDPLKRFQRASYFREALENLKPNINWVRKDINNWIGNSIKENNEFSLTINNKKTYSVEYHKNKRRVRAFCSSFDDLISAQGYLNSIVADSSFS